MKILKGRLKRIHVNQHIIKSNLKEKKDEACISVRLSDKTLYGKKININGPAVLIQDFENPLSCGAKIWLETTSEVEIL